MTLRIPDSLRNTVDLYYINFYIDSHRLWSQTSPKSHWLTTTKIYFSLMVYVHLRWAVISDLGLRIVEAISQQVLLSPRSGEM